jgi:ATP-dependent helicase/nuclease subunit A
MRNEVLDTAAALNPRASSVVEACAGSGKTWLLVSRMIRLLLAGAKPSELLAITFTRKAAQEMTSRLYEWLQLLATGEDGDVQKFLRDRSVPEAEIEASLPRARRLLETVLAAQPGPAVTTFHGWFLDLLKRAPLEAGLPWGAPLLEREKQLRDEVRDRLFSQWAGAPDSPEGTALLSLLEDIGESNLQSLLSHFVQARAEWLAYTENRADPVAFALEQIRPGLHADLDTEPATGFWSDELMTARAHRVGLALEKGTDAERRKGLAVLQAVADHDIESLRKRILKSDGGRLASKATKGLLAALASDAETYVRDYETLEAALENISALQSDQRVWSLNRHGLLLGHAFLQAYQQAKSERGVIDFADVEWLGCRLLESEEYAPALNLKLDARYRHLLLDEFQDTNPLQWRALSAWLADARAADSDMTVFMVGDPKQAIYRFRRGEARVFKAAADFLRAHFGADFHANNQTRRLAPGLVSAVNPVFAGIDGFAAHDCAEENQDLPGAVRCIGVTAPDNGNAEDAETLRDPLTTPLPEAADKAVHEEAREFARMLKQEVIGKWTIRGEEGERAAKPGDVMGLVRTRTHLKIYEQALEAAGIPYITSRRGGLLHALEAQDIIALLETLLLPHADLKLAHVLKSPLFACSDDELLQVFRAEGPRGWDNLMACARRQDCPARLQRAARLLSGWRMQAGTLPAHDLLDRIYFEGDTEARYAAAAPAAMRPQIAANLRAFMQLALTQDAGRYPSLGGFIRELKSLVDDADAAPEEGIAADGENAVRLLTIHGAKGLEAPVVWLLCGSHSNKGSHHDVLAPWPPQARRPLHFSLYGKKEDRGAFREAWFAEEAALNDQEETNLLYVALTRAQQGLIVSGDEARSREDEIKHPWFRRITAAWENAGHAQNLPLTLVAKVEGGTMPVSRMIAMQIGERQVSASPQSRAGAAGELFHACLERCAPPGAPRDLSAMAARLGLNADALVDMEARARALIAQPGLARYFDPALYRHARNELAILDQDGNLQRIDRLVEFEDSVWVIDYKTGDESAQLPDDALLAEHWSQLARYAAAAAQLYPGKRVNAALLLADGRLVHAAEVCTN